MLNPDNSGLNAHPHVVKVCDSERDNARLVMRQLN